MSGNVIPGPEHWKANIAESLAPDPELPGDLAGGGGPPHDPDMEARVAVLEQLAKDTKDTLANLRTDFRADITSLTTEMRGIRSEQRADYRWLLGIMIGVGAALLGAMAKGFHWF